LGDVEIKSRAVELCCDIAYGVNVSDHAVEGVAAGNDGEKLECGVGTVGFDAMTQFIRSLPIYAFV
jgi:hypothetical protein